jgi:hypothetical protein
MTEPATIRESTPYVSTEFPSKNDEPKEKNSATRSNTTVTHEHKDMNDNVVLVPCDGDHFFLPFVPHSRRIYLEKKISSSPTEGRISRRHS